MRNRDNGASSLIWVIVRVAEVVRLQGIAKRHRNSYEFGYENTNTIAHGQSVDLRDRVIDGRLQIFVLGGIKQMAQFFGRALGIGANLANCVNRAHANFRAPGRVPPSRAACTASGDSGASSASEYAASQPHIFILIFQACQQRLQRRVRIVFVSDQHFGGSQPNLTIAIVQAFGERRQHVGGPRPHFTQNGASERPQAGVSRLQRTRSRRQSIRRTSN